VNRSGDFFTESLANSANPTLFSRGFLSPLREQTLFPPSFSLIRCSRPPKSQRFFAAIPRNAVGQEKGGNSHPTCVRPAFGPHDPPHCPFPSDRPPSDKLSSVSSLEKSFLPPIGHPTDIRRTEACPTTVPAERNERYHWPSAAPIRRFPRWNRGSPIRPCGAPQRDRVSCADATATDGNTARIGSAAAIQAVVGPVRSPVRLGDPYKYAFEANGKIIDTADPYLLFAEQSTRPPHQSFQTSINIAGKTTIGMCRRGQVDWLQPPISV